MSDLTELQDLVDHNQNYNEEQHEILHQEIGTERKLRIAGDEANHSYAAAIFNEVSVNSSQLTEESLRRITGDIEMQNLLSSLNQSFSTEWGNLNTVLTALRSEYLLGINNAHSENTATNSRITQIATSFGAMVDSYQARTDARYDGMNNRITKYEKMLSDITLDQAQITADNGEVTAGAWTILSQARQWDLDILRDLKKYKADTTQEVNDALDDFQNQLPNTEQVINDAIEVLSNTQIIKNLDAAIKDNGIKLAEVNEALIAESQRIANEITNNAQAQSNALRTVVNDVQSTVNQEVQNRITAVQREAAIRQQQLRQQTEDLNTGIDERVVELTTQVNTVLNGAVTGFNSQVSELRNQDNYILSGLDTYKAVNDDRVTGVVNQVTINTNNVTNQASQLNAIQTTLGTRNRTFRQTSQPSSTGLVTGDTWINTASDKNFEVKIWSGSSWVAVTDPRISANATNIANQSSQITTLQNGVTANVNSITTLNVDVANIKAESATFAKAKAVEDLTAAVDLIDDTVSNHSTKITTLENTAEQLRNDVNTKATSAAFESLKSEVNFTKDTVTSNSSKITQLDNSILSLQGTIPTLATNSALNSLSSDLTVERNRITATTEQLNSLSSVVSGKASQSSLDTVNNRVTATENENTAQGNRLTGVEGGVNSLNNLVGANSSAISGLTNDVSAINQDLVAKAQRFDRIESNIRGLSLDTTPNLNQRNKWAFLSVRKPYPYMNQNVVPDYSYLNKFVAYASTYLNEDGTLPSTAEYENAIHYFRTALYVNQNKTITLTYFQGDDAHAVYLNNELIRTETGVAASALTLNLKQGWNLLDVIANNGGGPGGFSYGAALQSLVDVMAATRLVNVDQDANASATQALTTRVTSNEQAIATKAESSLVSNLQAQVNQNKADASQTYVTKADNNQSEATLGNQLTAAYKAADASVINTAAYDATVKANQAYNDSKTYVEQYAYGKATADQAVAGAIANYNAQLIIGANNLFTGTQEWLGTWTNIWAYEKTNDYYKGLRVLRTGANWSGVRQDIVYDENIQYTISAWIKKSQGDVGIHFWGDNLSSDAGAGTQKPMEPNVWTRVTHTFKGTGQVGTARFEKIDNGSTGYYDICGLKVERGNKATDWSPNPKDEVNALVLGGRNLFTKTTEFQLLAGANNAYRQDTGFVVTGVSENNAVLRLWKMDMPAGICTVSFDHYIGIGGFQMYVNANDGTPVGFVVESSQGWQHFELQFLITNPITNGWLDIIGLTGQPHSFKNFKVEKGNKATDYTPAPEDVASDINTVKANLQNFQEAQASVDLAQTNRLNSAESQLGANAARITNVEQTYATRDGVAALARSALQAEWQTYANDSVNSLQIGGVNLVKFSAGKFQPMRNSIDNYEYYVAYALLENGQTYTLSARTNGVFTDTHDYNTISVESNKAALWVSSPNGDNLKIISNPTTATTGSIFTWDGQSGWCPIRVNGYKADNSTWVSNIQIERGTKKTDWKPSPFDSEWELVAGGGGKDLNNFKTTGKFFIQGNVANQPVAPWFYLTVEKATDGRILQRVVKDNSPSENWIRYYFDVSWSEWVKSVTLNELNAFKSTVETIYSTKAEANSTTADIINRLTSKANQSGLDALSANVTNNYYTKAQTDSVAAGVVNRYRAELGNIINYTVVSRGNESGGVGYIQNAEGGWVVGGARSYTLVIFNGDGTINWSKNYDIFGNSALNQNFYDDIAALPNGVYVVIFTSDEPASGRNADLLFPALRMLGGTREVNDKLVYRGSYMLIGRKGMVEGTAVELVAPIGQTITYGLQFVNGVPVGIGSTPTAMPSQFASATAVQNIQADVSNINGQVSSQAYSITELRSDLNKIGSAGPNLLKNSDFSSKDTSNWEWSNTNNAYVANDLNWEYALSSAGDSRYMVVQGGQTAVELFQFVPVEPNKIYQVSAYVASHRSSVKIYVSWWGKDMSYLGYTGDNVAEWSKNGDGAPQATGGSVGLPNTRRIYQNNIAHPNAYYMKVTLGRSAGDDPYMWATRLNAVEINSLTTPIIPWGESGAGTGIKLTETAKVVDGIKGVRITSIDNNGFISGFGLISEVINGIVRSAFGVNANYFYVGTSDDNKKKPFMVLTENQTINGVSYPAGTWMDVAVIANATIGTAHIADAAITNAKIANLDAAKITSGYINADRIQSKSITADKLIIGEGSNAYMYQYNETGNNGWNGVEGYVYDLVTTGNALTLGGRDHIAPGITMINMSAGDVFTIEVYADRIQGNASLNAGFWLYKNRTTTAQTPWLAVEPIQSETIWSTWKKYTYQVTVTDGGGDVNNKVAYGLLYFQVNQWDGSTKWRVGNIKVMRSITKGLLVNGSITAEKLNADVINAISVSARNFTSTGSDGSKYTQSGGNIKIYYPNGQLGIELGV